MTEIEKLQTLLTAERERAATLQQQAEIWAQEARTQKATVHEIYQLCTGSTGELGDWHGAEPVRAVIAERDALRERVDGLARDAERYRLARKICSFRFTCRNSMQVDLYDALEALFDALEDATAAEYAGAADKTLDAALAALEGK